MGESFDHFSQSDILTALGSVAHWICVVLESDSLFPLVAMQFWIFEKFGRLERSQSVVVDVWGANFGPNNTKSQQQYFVNC